MDCDIHGTLEAKIDGKWVMIKEYDYNTNFGSRNYDRFAKLANVRGYGGRSPKGIPLDVSEGTKFHIDRLGSDGHSHSFMDARLIAAIFVKTAREEPCDHVLKYPEEHFLDLDREYYDSWQKHEYRVVFWFDN